MAQLPFSAEIGFATLNDTEGDTHYLQGSADPSVAGVAAPISSQYNRINGVDSTIYMKFGVADTDWAAMSGAGSSSEYLSAPTDGVYTDGLFPWQPGTTKKSDAFDDVNEVLAALAPANPPTLSQVDMSQTGVAAKLSFGASNVVAGYANVTGEGPSAVLDINDLFSVSGKTRGVFGSVTASGVLNNQVIADAKNSFPADAFGSGNTGTLELEVNGVVVHTVDLSVFGSGTSANGNGSGFTLSAATPVQFESGTPFPAVQYRTGSWTVAAADLRDGYNYIRVNHNTGSDNFTDYVDFVRDSNAVAMTATAGALDTLVMTGSKFLSGVEYHTGGTALYDVTINNPHQNVYPNGTAITFVGTNCSASSQAFGNISDETEAEVITDKTVTITNSGRLLDASIAVGVSVAHPIKTNLTNQQNLSIAGILLDGVGATSSAISESFDDENFRIASVAGANANNYSVQANVTNALNAWDSQLDISSTGTAGHADGLLVYNGALQYPTSGVDSGDFRNVADGNVNGPENGHAGNPNYSAVTNNSSFYRKFVNNSGLTKANFRINIAGTGSFKAAAGGPSGQQLTVEMKFPDGSITTGTGWLDCYGDFATANWSDGAGCRNASQGTGRVMGTNWGLTVGTKSIANGESVVIRITAASSWTGAITAISLVWL